MFRRGESLDPRGLIPFCSQLCSGLIFDNITKSVVSLRVGEKMSRDVCEVLDATRPQMATWAWRMISASTSIKLGVRVG